jgi:hypothetical protein
VLRAVKRLLRPGGRLALATIYVTPGLSPAARRRAHRAGPRAVAARIEQTALLTSAGFGAIGERDVTAEFAVTSRAWLTEWEAHADVLAPLEPPGCFDQRQRERRAQLAATEDGLLRRGLFSATRMARPPT